ncbi:MAG: 30S ribosomal protein S12 methylthiotransferase RimO [Treponema sp.]|nr:30S ribosomal protein S12 methylthiotransferase RimO [Treponema sp.]
MDQHGCAKNQVDGELLLNHFLDMGMEQTFKPEEADFIVINSCGFIESAKKESLDAVVSAKRDYPDAKILLTGCLAERYAGMLKDALPEADGIFGNGNISKIDEFIRSFMNGERLVETYKQEGVCCGERKVLLSYPGSAFIKITEGCSNHCSFCAIPIIRGELRSRRAADIVEEIRKLVSRGIVEFNLIGQDLAAYGTGVSDDVFGEGRSPLPVIENGINHGTRTESALARLLKMISEIPGNFIVRTLYIHPDHFNRDILPVMQKDKRLLPYFDIPFQSGDDTIVRSMNRKGSSEEYIRLVKDIREALPDATLRTTFLTGFPGETDENAENTLSFLKAIESDWSGCFPYSREEDTPAYSFKGRVRQKLAKERAERLVAVQAEITEKHLKSHVGKEYDVLIEEVVEGEEGIAIGRAWFQAPDVDGSVVVRYEKDIAKENDAVKPGRFVRAKILASSEVDLDGVFTGDSELNKGVPVSAMKFATEMQEV